MSTVERRSGARGAPGRGTTLGFLLREVYEALQTEVYAAVAADGHPAVRETHSPVLRHLPPDGARVADLARAAGYAKQSMAYLVDDLAALGYVTTGPDPTDGRAKLVRLTARGRHLVDKLVAHSEAAERRLAAKIGAKAVAAMRDALAAAVDASGRDEDR
jgi:DNA-binding MarR family transcriptional regulator